MSLWLPAGFWVAVLLLRESAEWPLLILVANAANVTFDLFHGTPVWASLGLACANTVEAVAGAWLFRRFVARTPELSSLRSVLGLLGFSAVLNSALGATVGAAALVWTGLAPSYFRAWNVWWIGNSMANLLVAPLVVAWVAPRVKSRKDLVEYRQQFEAGFLGASLVAVVWYLLVMNKGAPSADLFLAVPLVLWAAVRFGVRGATAVNLLLALVLIFAARSYLYGLEVGRVGAEQYLVTLQMYLAISAAVGLVPAVAIAERNRLLMELAGSEERFRNLAAAANEGVVITEEGRVLDVNDQALKLFGCERGDIVGRDVADLVSEDTKATVAEAIATHRELAYEHKLIRKDGSLFDAEAQAKVIRTGDRVLRVTAIRDVSERKQAEALLVGQYHVLEMIAAGKPLADILNSLIRLVESQASGLVGSVFLRDGASLRFVAAPSLPETFGAALDAIAISEDSGPCGRAAHGNRAVYVENIASEPGERRFTKVALAHGLQSCWSTPITDGKNHVLGAFALYTRQPGLPTARHGRLIDAVTHLASVAISRQLAESALKLSDFSVNQASTPTFWVAQDGAIIRVNRAACELLGYSEVELMGRTVPELSPGLPGGSWEKHWQGVRDARRMRIHATQRHKDGHLIPIEADLNWFEFEGSEYEFMFVRDTTERIRLEEQLRQSQKMEAIGQLSGGIAHDFNNLLTVILGNLGIIRMAAGIPKESAEPLEHIGIAAGRAANLTRQLLEFSRKGLMRSQDEDLNELVGTFSKMLGRVIGETVDFQLELSSELLPVSADRSMMEQVMLNLCLNARDAMPKGGRLTLRTTAVVFGPEDVQRMPFARPGSFARLSVTDTGAGIDPKYHERIFEPFFTTKEVGKGTGLGLASVYGILQQHEGWVSVASEVGRGTTFSVHLPLRGAAKPAAEQEAAASDSPGGSGKVLLVEDDLAVRLVVEKALTQLGYGVIAAGSAEEAKRLWPRHQHDIQVMLTDMVMPGGMGGADIARMFKADKPSLKVILMSGYSPDLAGTDFASSGGDFFLGKPFQIREMAEALRACMTGPRQPPKGDPTIP